MRVWSDYVIIDLIVFAGHKVLCFKQNLGGRFSNRYIWGIIDVKGIVSGSSKCYMLWSEKKSHSIWRDFLTLSMFF